MFVLEVIHMSLNPITPNLHFLPLVIPSSLQNIRDNFIEILQKPKFEEKGPKLVFNGVINSFFQLSTYEIQVLLPKDSGLTSETQV